MKRLIALVLCAALLLCCVPASLASFSDVTDPALSQKLDLLHALGIFQGVPGGAFLPDGILTRASFCVLAVRLSTPDIDPSLYTSYIKFPDVRAGHWALGWVNAASSLGLVSGYPNGSFGPDDAINYGQTLTVLMHVLGYKDEQVGMNWPYSYINKAASIGLSKEFSFAPTASISRATAARLIYNLLSLPKMGETTPYLSKFGVTESQTILLSTSALMPDGITPAVLTSDGLVACSAAPSSSSAGRMGTALLNKDDVLMSFSPSQQTIQTVVVKDATNLALTGTDGKTYAAPARTPVYDADSETPALFSAAWVNIFPGQTVLLAYSASGALQYLYLGSLATGGQLTVLRTPPTGNPVTAAFGAGAASATLYKNGAKCAVSDLCQWDVLTYLPLTNTVQASNIKLTGVYENGAPNWTSPTQITTMGHTFSLSPLATASIQAYTVGARLTFLLAYDGSIADVVPYPSLASDTVGWALPIDDDRQTVVTLPNGLTFETDAAERALFSGQLATLMSTAAGSITATRVSYTMPSGALNLQTNKLGSLDVSPYCQFYQSAGADGHVWPVSRDSLPKSVISRSMLYHAGIDATGKVTEIIMQNTLYDGYSFGPLAYDDVDPESVSYLTSVLYAGSKFFLCYPIVPAPMRGTIGGIVGRTFVNGDSALADYVICNRYPGLSRYDFGADGLLLNGKTVPIADGVLVYIPRTGQSLPIDEARALASSFVAYTDPADVRVRYITAS